MDEATTRTLLRRAITIAAEARARGDHPFGALLADSGGAVLLEAGNRVVTGRDVTAHAETELVRLAWRELGPDALAATTLVTSCEPCAMCSGAIGWSGIGAVVFGLAEECLLELTGADPANPTMHLPCRTVFAALQHPVAVTGPLLEDESRTVHDGFWHP